jgi:hypothetical protein
MRFNLEDKIMNTAFTKLTNSTTTSTCSNKSDDTLMDEFIDELKELSDNKEVKFSNNQTVSNIPEGHILLIEQQLKQLKNNINKLEHIENIISFYDASLNIQNKNPILNFIKEKIEALVASTGSKKKYFEQNIFDGNDNTRTLEGKKRFFITNIQPWHKGLQAKLLAQKLPAITSTSTHSEENAADTATASSNNALAEIGTLTENNFTATPTMITRLRNNMAAMLKSILEPGDRITVASTLIDIIKDKVLSRDENSAMWNPATRNLINCSIFETNILTTLFPHSKTKTEVMNILDIWNNNLNDFPNDIYNDAIDIFVKTDMIFIDRNSLGKYCQEKGLDYNQIEFVISNPQNEKNITTPNHFTIKNRSPDFIHPDGNCGFHCLAYLLYQRELARQNIED